jgi:hypothetical protein
MHNYYNIIPSVLLDILILFFFESLILLIYVIPLQESAISKQLIQIGIKSKDFFVKLDQSLQQNIIDINSKFNQSSDSPQVNAQLNSGKILFRKPLEFLRFLIDPAKTEEQKNIKTKRTNYILIFTFTSFGLILLLLLIGYLFNKTINWKPIIISTILILLLIIIFEICYFVLLIIIFEICYFVFILSNKKHNEDKAKKIAMDYLLN